MWRELINIWKSDNLLKQAFKQAQEMLQDTFEMFKASKESLRSTDSAELAVDVYEKDQRVNRFEQEVRRKVLKHLAITGNIHLSPGLVLASVVIDIERIGDYTKNIMDLAKLHPRKLHCGPYEEDIQKIEMAMVAMFEKVLPAFETSDTKLVNTLVQDNWWIVKKCDEIVNNLISKGEGTLSSGDSVATAMYARYLKRVAAHLMNVNSGITNPFEKIGYHGANDAMDDQ